MLNARQLNSEHELKSINKLAGVKVSFKSAQ